MAVRSIRSNLMSLTLLGALLTASATALAAAPAVDARPTVAVLYFDYTGKDAELDVLKKGLAQMLISDLSALEQVRLVERDRLQEVIAELKLQQSRQIDPKTAGRIGKLLGARYMVLGGYFAMMGTLRVDARVVETETGKIIKSVGSSGKQDDFIAIEQKVSEGLAGILSAAMPPPEADRKANGRKPARAAPPKRLHTRTAVRYAKALDAKDRGDVKAAKAALEAVVKERPDFRLAQLDLAAMVR